MVDPHKAKPSYCTMGLARPLSYRQHPKRCQLQITPEVIILMLMQNVAQNTDTAGLVWLSLLLQEVVRLEIILHLLP